MILILTQHCLDDESITDNDDDSITDNASLIWSLEITVSLEVGYVSGAPGEEDRKVTLDIAPPVSVYNYSSVSPDLPPSSITTWFSFLLLLQNIINSPRNREYTSTHKHSTAVLQYSTFVLFSVLANIEPENSEQK